MTPPNRWLVRSIFHDPTGTGVLNLRLVGYSMTELAPATDLSEDEQERFFKLLLMVANKMAAVWYHADRYREIERKRVEAAIANPIVPGATNPTIELAIELFYELDAFLVQVKSTLDHLVKVPRIFIGATWNLTTFGARGREVENAARNLPKKYGRLGDGFIMLIDDNRRWLEDLIRVRDRINHLQEGGVDPTQFAVFAQKALDGTVRSTVPMWTPGQSISEAIGNVWPVFFGFCEAFIALSVIFRLKEEWSLAHVPLKPEDRQSTQSPWRLFPRKLMDEVSDGPGFRKYEPPAPPAPAPGRNDPCPCGSGKKYKQCCLSADQQRMREKRV